MPPPGDLPSLDDFMKQSTTSNQEFQQTLSSSNLQFQQNMSAIVQDLKTQVGQLANSVSQLQSAGSGNLPSQPIPNPRGNASVVSLRSGKELQAAPLQKPRSASTESKLDADSQPPQQASPIPVPFPSRTLSARKPESDEELLKMFRKVEINIPLLDAIKQIPKYAKFLKELCVHKRKKMKGGVELGGIVSALTRNDDLITGTRQALPKKCRDPGIFSIPCTIGDCTFADAMLDLGASINVMPTSIYKSLNCGDLEPTGMTIQLANRSVVQPLGVLEDVLVQVDELIFPADFYVLDMEDETPGKGSTLILGRPFLMTAKTKIDVHVGTLSMEFGDTLVQFNIFEAMKHPMEDTSLFGIDLIDELVKEYMQADTGSTESFQVAGNTDILDCLGSVFEEPNHDEPWGVHDAKVTTTLAHLEHESKGIDSFDQVRKNEKPECSKHLEVQVVGTTKQQSAQIANTFVENESADMSRDWTKTESMSVMKADTNAVEEDWKQAGIRAETKSAKQHEEQPEAGIMSATQVLDSNQVGQTASRPIGEVSPPKPPIELKPLPDHLKYAYLGDEQQFPVIIASNLYQEQEEKLLQVLKQHKKAIGWKLSDLPGINPSICMHRILMEEEARPIRQQQRRLNPTILEVVKKEVTKLLAAGIIYPISDSSWVSPVQVVPKKSGMTVMKNRNDELVPTRVQNSWRVCIDYRKLNQATRKDHFPLPFLDQVLEKVAGKFDESQIMHLEDVLVQVDELIFPADFCVLDMEDETLAKRSTVILGRPFLMSTKTKIDVHAKTLSMEFGDTLVQLNIFEAMKHPVEDTSLFGIDLIDKLVEEYMQVDTRSTKFFQVAGNTDILECLGSVFEEPDYDEPWEVHDTKVTTTLAHLDHDSKSIDSFDQPLLDHLKYAYLGDEQQFPIIISNNLHWEQVLKQYKKAIRWKLSDLPGINPSICMHKILMEEEARLVRQQ
ncbi:hypothetical protein CR513_13451, partial [Mucuna pruriens]